MSDASDGAAGADLGAIDEAFLEALTAIAIKAGRAILKVRASAVTAETKSDGSPVTEADRQAEAIILKGLREIAPATPVVAEEEAAAGRIPEVGAQFFLVDPLDGTKEFLRGVGDGASEGGGDFTVNIGLIQDGAPIAGVVYAPAIGRLWSARPGGAWVAEVRDGVGAGPKTPIEVRRPPADSVIAVASRSHRSPETDAFLNAYKVADVRSAGSSLKFCLVAEGVADLYPRLGRTMEWDTAAADAVLRAAGGRTVTLNGAPLLYGKGPTENDTAFANPYFVALGGVDYRSET